MTTRTLVLLALSAILTLFVVTSACAIPAGLEKAIKLYHTGQVEQAVAVLEKAVAESKSDNADTLNWLGFLYLRTNRLQDALTTLEKAVKLRPKSVEIHNNLGTAYMRSGDYPRAMVEYKEMIKLKPKLPDGHYNLANVCVKAGDLDLAIEEYKKTVALNPTDAAALNCLGMAIKQKSGYTPEAIAAFEEATRLGPSCATYFLNLGLAYKDTGKPDLALAALKRAVGLQPRNYLARASYAETLSENAQYQEAAGQYTIASGISPNEFIVHYNLGVIYSKAGEFALAAQEYRKALEIQPSNSDAMSGLGWALFKVGKPDDAVAQLKAASKVKPDEVEIYNRLVIVYMAQKNEQGTAEAWTEILRLQPSNTTAMISLANRYFPKEAVIEDSQKPQVQKALDLYKKAVAANPTLAEAHVGIGICSDRLGDIDAAIKEYREAIRLNGKLAVAYYNLGAALEKKNQPKEAEAEYRKALELDPNLVDAKTNLDRLTKPKA